MTNWATLITKRVLASAMSMPTMTDLKNVTAASGLGALYLVIMVQLGLFRWQPIKNSRALGWAAAYMTFRATAEELLFRAAFLPHPKVDGIAQTTAKHFAWASLFPLVLFVLSHTLTTQRQGSKVLNDTKFLVTLALVGAMCTWAYWVSSGALSAAITMHFLTVFPWMILLGGYKATHTPTPLKKGTGAVDLAPSGMKAE